MKRNALLFVCLSVLLAAAVVISVIYGSIKASPYEVLHILANGNDGTTLGRVIFDIRLPRVTEALFLGGALAVSGYLLQTFFLNPIAGPYILGISSGAKLFVAVLMVCSLNGGFTIGSGMMVAAAFLGSIIATGFVLLVSIKVRSMSILVVCGVMVGYICSAITELIVAMADDYNIVNLHNWSMGTFSSAAWSDSAYYIPIVIICCVIAFFLSKTMEAFMFGETYARTVGINVRAFRVTLIIVSSLLSATVTAFAGPISFVGIAVPHLVRTMFKTAKPMVIIPASFMTGAVFCLFCDLLARGLFAPAELSISTITAIFGAPVVISMMLGSGRGKDV